MPVKFDLSPNKQFALRGYWLLSGMSIFWGLNWPIMKIVLQEIPPWTFRTISGGYQR